MKLFSSSKNKLFLLVGLSILLVAVELSAMQSALRLRPQIAHGPLFVKTSDNKVMKIDRWKIAQMKVLLVFSEQQKGANSALNAIKASMISSQELELLDKALSAAQESVDAFEKFWSDRIQADKNSGVFKSGQPLSLSQTMLINAAQKVEATGLSALCLSCVMPSDAQKDTLVPLFIDSVLSCFEGKRKVFLPGHKNGVELVALSPDGKMVVSVGYDDKHITLWNISDLSDPKKQNLEGHLKDIRAIAFSPDGKSIVSGCLGDQNNLIMWDVSKWDSVSKRYIGGCPFSVLSLAFSSDGTKLVIHGSNFPNNLFLLDLKNEDSVASIGFYPFIQSVAINFDDTKIVVGCSGYDDRLILLDISDENNITHKSIGRDLNSIYSVAFTPDGKIVSGGQGTEDNLIVWDISNPNAPKKQVLAGHPANVNSVAVSSDGKRIISGCWYNEDNLILWDISDLKRVKKQIFEGHLSTVESVAFGMNGKRIVSGSDEPTDNLIVWQLISDEDIQTLKNCNVAQARLVWQLCLKASSNMPLTIKDNSPDCAIFMSLSGNIQEMLKNVLGVTCSGKSLMSRATVPVQTKERQPTAQERELISRLTDEELANWDGDLSKLEDIFKNREKKQKESKRTILEERKAGIRKDLSHPKFQDKKLFAEYIARLKEIYQPGDEYYEAFVEVMKEMGL